MYIDARVSGGLEGCSGVAGVHVSAGVSGVTSDELATRANKGKQREVTIKS